MKNNNKHLIQIKTAFAAPLSIFVMLSFIMISGVVYLSSYQSYISESQEELKQLQLQNLKESRVSFKISNENYDEIENITFEIKNTGLTNIYSNELTYFLNNTYITNITGTEIGNTSNQVSILAPQSSMLVTYSYGSSQNYNLSFEVIHDSTFNQNFQLTPPLIIGEISSFSVQNNENIIISFQREYDEVPALFMTPKTENAGGDVPYVPIIHSINTTHANVSLCQDNGALTCDLTYVNEEVSYMVFDINKTNDLSWIEIGSISASTNGATTPISFTKTFDNIPYVFAQAQTYIIDSVVSNGIGAHSWFPTVSTTTAQIVGCDHPGITNVCAGTSTENFTYLALDPILLESSIFEVGTQSIANSDWTSISFSNSYTNPEILVMQNSEIGGEDPQYPWARNLDNSGADIRYCEADASGVCNTHSAENVMWLAANEGIIEINLN